MDILGLTKAAEHWGCSVIQFDNQIFGKQIRLYSQHITVAFDVDKNKIDTILVEGIGKDKDKDALKEFEDETRLIGMLIGRFICT